jgi:steroid delta-isomerase-like uncharacterized protein
MSRDQLLTVATRYFEIVSQGDLEALGEILSPDFIQHTPGVPPGPAGAQAVLALFLHGFPDFAVTVDWLLADGDKVVVRSRARGTHTGPFMGHPPSGRSFTATGIDVLRVSAGRIVERWSEFDTFAMLQQLALVATPWSTDVRPPGGR